MVARTGTDDGHLELRGKRNCGTWVRGVVLTGPWVDLGLGCGWRPWLRPLGELGAGSCTEGVEDFSRVRGAVR